MKKNNLIVLGIIIVMVAIIGLSYYRRHQNTPMVIKPLNMEVTKMVIMMPQLGDDHEGHDHASHEKTSSEAEAMSLEVTKQEDNQWFIGEEEYLANTRKIEDIITEITRERRIDLVSELGNNYMYELDEEQRTLVEVYGEGENLLRTYALGKASSVGSHVYLMKDSDTAIYQTIDSFRNVIETEVEALREKKIFSFASSEAKTLEIKEGGSDIERLISEVVVTNEISEEGTQAESPSPQTKLVWQDNEGRQYDHAKITKIMDILSTLEVEDFLEDNAEDLKKETLLRQYRVRIRNDIYELMILQETMTRIEGEESKSIYRVYSPSRKYGFSLKDRDIEVLIQDYKELYIQETS